MHVPGRRGKHAAELLPAKTILYAQDLRIEGSGMHPLVPIWRRRSFTVASCVLALILAGGFGLRSLKHDVDKILKLSSQQVTDRKKVYLKSRTIIPQARRGFALLPVTIQARSGATFQNHIFVTSNQGLLQYDLGGREVRRYTALEGLPGTPATAITKTADALWIAAAPQGLLKFDGSRFEYFEAERASDFEVTALLALPTGELWIGTRQRGLLIFQGDRAMEFAPRLEAKFITCLHGNSDQTAIGTFSEGVFLFRRGVLTQLRKEPGKHGSLLDNQVTAITGDSQELYVGTPLGINEIRDTKTTRTFLEGHNIYALARASSLLAGTCQGLVRLNTRLAGASVAGRMMASSASRVVRLISGLGPVQGLLPLAEGGLALSDLGIHQTDSLDSDRWRTFGPGGEATPWPGSDHAQDRSAPFHLADVNISALAIDRDQNLWIGYFDRGLEVFSTRGERLVHRQDDRLFCVNHVLPLPGGDVMVSTANGLAAFHGTELRHFITEQDGLIHRAVATTLPVGSAGDDLLAATAEGVTLLRGSRPLQSLFTLHGLASNRVYSAGSFGGRIYLGTLGGISVLEKSRIAFSWNTSNSGLAVNWVNAMAPLDRQLFVGTYGGGVQSVNEAGEWTDYGATIGKFEVNPNAMGTDSGKLFVGSLDRGFFIYDLATNRWQQVQDSLPSQNVTAFAFDSASVLVGTDRGLLRIRKEAL